MPITGTINIGGGSQVLYDTTTNKSTGIDFYCGGSYACGGAVNMFPAPTGDFASVAYLTLNSFDYSSIPSQEIWSINSGGLLYSFTLTSMQVESGDQMTGCGTGYFGCLVLSGNGYFSITDMYRQLGLQPVGRQLLQPELGISHRARHHRTAGSGSAGHRCRQPVQKIDLRQRVRQIRKAAHRAAFLCLQ
jgi:hypothetical protein